MTLLVASLSRGKSLHVLGLAFVCVVVIFDNSTALTVIIDLTPARAASSSLVLRS